MINNEAITLNNTIIECIRWCILVTLFFVALSFFMKIVIFIIKGCTLKEILYKYYKYRWSVALGFGILSMISIFWILFAYVFNQGELFRISMDTRISTKMEDWGGFATCVTAIFALVSVFLAFKAFSSQTLAAKRASFDATFTQIFAQHSILYKKVQCLSLVHCHFAEFRRYFQFRIYYCAGPVTNQQIWEEYNRRLQIRCGEECSSNFKNYFKYIYKEVVYIMNNSSGLLNDADQRQYVGLIEGQMNNDELFCYLVNQLEYYENHRRETKRLRKLIRYFRYLKDNNFFREICMESSGYQQDVIDALKLFQQEIGESSLVDDVYDLLTRRNWFL